MNSLKIRVVWGCSEGPTKISAFDSALNEAGIHNLNLITLSSVIPPNTEVIEVGKIQQKEPVGSLGKVVLTHIEGMKCWIAAGLGWATADKGGLFVESALVGRSIDCREEIVRGLENMIKHRSWNWNPEHKVKILEVKARSNCFSSIVVTALYSIERLVRS